MIVVDLPESWDELAQAHMASAMRIAQLEDDLKIAQKVADAAVVWLACESVETDRAAWSALEAAIKEYRKLREGE